MGSIAEPHGLVRCIAGFGPMLGQVGHFYKYAPEEVPYAKKRYMNEAKRCMTLSICVRSIDDS